MPETKTPREVLADSRVTAIGKLDFGALHTALLSFLAEEPSLREFASVMHHVPMSAFMLGMALGLKDEKEAAIPSKFKDVFQGPEVTMKELSLEVKMSEAAIEHLRRRDILYEAESRRLATLIEAWLMWAVYGQRP